MSNTSLLGSYGAQDNSSLMFRNKVINGAMTIDQRNSGAAATITANASSVYTLDRWRVFSAGSNATVQRVAGSGSNQYALRITGLASNTGTVLEQRIEAANCYDLINNTVTVSFQVSSTSITSLNWSADYPTGGVDNWSGATAIASGSVTISSTNNTYSFTFNAGANVVNGLRITFTTGALLGSQTITYQQIQLEAGPTATPFERRPIGQELALAQRYYWRVENKGATADVLLGLAMGAGTNTAFFAMSLPVTMRAIPAISGSCVVANANASIVDPSTAFSQILSQTGVAGTVITVTNSSLTANSAYRVLLNSSTAFFAANAEL